MSLALPMPEMPPDAAIDIVVAAFAELLYAPALAVVCRLRPTGDVVAVNACYDTLPAMLAVWACSDETTTAEAHPTGPLTAEEEEDVR
jgi:hypothetical protein